MRKYIFEILYVLRIHKIFYYLLQRNRITILLLHDPKYDSFKKMVDILNRYYNFISLEEVLNKSIELPKYPIIITFDDGHLGNMELLPVIEEYKIKPTIFLCSKIVNSNRVFWFKHSNITRSRINEIKTNRHIDFFTLLKEFNVDHEMTHHNRVSLNYEEIAKMQKHVSIGSHTQYHPILPTCSDQTANNEIKNSKSDLNRLTDSEIKFFAFPNGDFSSRCVNFCKKAGYEKIFSVEPGYLTLEQIRSSFVLPRFALDDEMNKHELIIKASGFWGYVNKYLRRITGYYITTL